MKKRWLKCDVSSECGGLSEIQMKPEKRSCEFLSVLTDSSWCILNSAAAVISASHPLTPSCVLFLFLWKQLRVAPSFRNESRFHTWKNAAVAVSLETQPTPATETLTSHFDIGSGAPPASGPLSCYGGWSSTQHPHAALWPCMSSWTSSENSFPPPAEK